MRCGKENNPVNLRYNIRILLIGSSDDECLIELITLVGRYQWNIPFSVLIHLANGL